MHSESARPIDAKKHLWYAFGGKKVVTLKDKAGNVIQLKKGDLFGVQNLNNRVDRVVVPSRPDIRFLLPVETVSDLIDLSKRHRQEVKFDAPPEKVKAPKKISIKIKEVKPEKSAKIDRLAAIKRAAAKPVNKTRKQKVELLKSPVKKKREVFDLDEDTFDDDGPELPDYLR